jgi:hypothetical protein
MPRHNMQVVTLRPRGFIPHRTATLRVAFVEWPSGSGAAPSILMMWRKPCYKADLLTTTPLTPRWTWMAYDYSDADLQSR